MPGSDPVKNVYASSQIIEKDKKEILEAFADAVLQAILNSNINKYETNQKKMLETHWGQTL